jgi:hypothetical protein
MFGLKIFVLMKLIKEKISLSCAFENPWIASDFFIFNYLPACWFELQTPGCLNKSIEFFASQGFRFNPRFTDEKASCMIIG